MAIETIIWFIPLPPLLAFAIIALFTRRSKGLSHWIAIIGAGLSWLGSMIVFVKAISTEGLSEHPFVSSIKWLPTGENWLEIGVQIDPLSAITLFFVAWTVLMIFVYSVGYHNFGKPKGDHDRAGLQPHGATIKDKDGQAHKVPSVEPMYTRFFAFFGLFAFGMFALVVSNNLLTLYMSWEIMGLCSYLLIGFWYGKKSARDAAVKAFMTTRVGDMFMLMGMVALYSLTGTLNFQEILANEHVLHELTAAQAPILGLSWAGLIGLLIFIGTVGKSAQFPLHVWLPDAMEGPTPVSAMIHAATMVSAGVYLSIRFFPLISAGWVPGEALTPTMLVIATIGGFTALFAATIAVAQNDVKRVLAYSTISQLGYMVAAIGIGSYVAAVFHLMTHAFFKALLFLGSGSVIHGMEHGVLHTGEDIDPQDMLNMGGLRRKMPRTFWTFLIGGFALSGFPLITAGFWSKDEILSGAFNGGQMIIFVTLALAALLTAFYTMRQITLTFLGKPRSKSAEHAHESAHTMTIPLIILAVFAIGIGWIGIPEQFPVIGGLVPNFMEEFVGSMLSGHGEPGLHGAVHHSSIPLITSLVVALGGLFLGWRVYRNIEDKKDPLQKPLGGLHTLLKNKYYFDELYEIIFIKPAKWFSEVFTYQWIDKKIIDGILHGVGSMALGLGKFFRNVIDIPVINKGGDALGEGTRRTGSGLRSLQKGRAQQYMVFSMIVVVILSSVFYYLFVLA
ncbi:MAG: NADH-quinone oxidoreductase subunit L [Anaerolineaceae bacterium]|nr:NADH-quinone oxidoreductase subunit L [Anaerolineaceae bacterium]